MGSPGELRDDAAETGVQVDLARDHGGEHVPAVDDDGSGGLVARGFDAEHRDRPVVVAEPAGSRVCRGSGSNFGQRASSTKVVPGTSSANPARRSA